MRPAWRGAVMSDKYQTLSAAIEAWGGGALLNGLGVLFARLMWHVGRVRKGERRFFGPELVYELPIAFGMAIFGESVAAWIGLPSPSSTALVAGLAYLGPRGAEVLFTKWFDRKYGGGNGCN